MNDTWHARANVPLYFLISNYSHLIKKSDMLFERKKWGNRFWHGDIVLLVLYFHGFGKPVVFLESCKEVILELLQGHLH